MFDDNTQLNSFNTNTMVYTLKWLYAIYFYTFTAMLIPALL